MAGEPPKFRSFWGEGKDEPELRCAAKGRGSPCLAISRLISWKKKAGGEGGRKVGRSPCVRRKGKRRKRSKGAPFSLYDPRTENGNYVSFEQTW